MSTQTHGPLAGLTVVDFSTLLPGPYASMLLANMGAEIIKIESPTRPDLIKSLPPFVAGHSVADLQLNRNKYSVVVDLKSAQGREVALNLIGQADIVLEQFRPGVMKKLGLGYDDVQSLFPSLVYCSLTGYGQTGPWSQRAGHDLNYLAVAGMSAYTGRKGQAPLPLGAQFSDLAGGSHHAVMGVLAAVIARQRTGRGSHVDISMTDAMFAMNGMAGAAALATGVDPENESEWLNGGSFYDYYRCADDCYIAVSGLEPQFVEALANCLERPQLRALQQLYDKPLQAKWKAVLQEIFATEPRDHWLELFAGHDVCVTPVLSINQAAEHEQIQARDMVVEETLEDGTTLRQMGDPIKFSAYAGATKNRVAPRTGQDTREKLLALGYTPQKIDDLHTTQVIFAEDNACR